MKRDDIQIRDPYILCAEGFYYLYGTTDPDPWRGEGVGFDVYVSRDLEEWEGPHPAFRPSRRFWGRFNFWAPEVHVYGGAYYLFASFKAEGHCRATQVFRAASPLGPFRPHSPDPLTPRGWECLDGTLYVEGEQPWMVFCREWVQVHDGEIWAVRLSEDLLTAVGAPVLLFRASSASWPAPLERRDGSGRHDARVTDGPFLWRGPSGRLYLLWSSLGSTGYEMGVAVSRTGKLEGPWIHEPEPLLVGDRGHAMIFRTLDGRWSLAYHHPNRTPEERFHYVEVEESEEGLRLKGEEH